MSHSEKSEAFSESISIARFPVSPSFFHREDTQGLRENAENICPRSPLIGQQRLPRAQGFLPFTSPNTTHPTNQETAEFLPLVSQQFDLPLEARGERYLPSGLVNGKRAHYFSPLLTIPAFSSPKMPKDQFCTVVSDSRIIFNPLKASNSPVHRNVILQETIGENCSGLEKVFSISLKKFNSFYNLTKSSEIEETETKQPLEVYLSRRRKGIRKDKRRETAIKNVSDALEMPPKKRFERCNCKNSACLKDYCDCFRKQRACGIRCRCIGCKNEGIENRENKAKLSNLSQKSALNAKISSEEASNKNFEKKEKRLESSIKKENGPMKCNCKKSMCVKKYCECFSNGAFCTADCSCEQCLNLKKSG